MSDDGNIAKQEIATSSYCSLKYSWLSLLWLIVRKKSLVQVKKTFCRVFFIKPSYEKAEAMSAVCTGPYSYS